MKHFVWLLLAVTLIGCGDPWDGEPIALKYDTLQEWQEERVVKALRHMSGMPVGSGDSRLLEVSEFSGPALNVWLNERVKVLLGRKFDFVKNMPEPAGSTFSKRVGTTTYTSYSEYWTAAMQAIGHEVVMANVGAGLYTSSRAYGNVPYVITVRGSPITVRNPREGITMALDRMFNSLEIEDSDSDSMAHSMAIISTLLHEARHSDNDTHPHVQCTHDARQDFCDNASNGPNGVKVTFLKYALEVGAEHFSDSEKTALQGYTAEYADRINSGATIVVPAPPADL